eukprot:scaffold1140_cov85-Skeletonema_dohrnii-CCMP3373.AAC.4
MDNITMFVTQIRVWGVSWARERGRAYVTPYWYNINSPCYWPSVCSSCDTTSYHHIILAEHHLQPSRCSINPAGHQHI